MLLLATGCARLPDYAMPRVELVEASQLAKTDGIPYRKLTRGDFRAKQAPIANADHDNTSRRGTTDRDVGDSAVDLELDRMTGLVDHSPQLSDLGFDGADVSSF